MTNLKFISLAIVGTFFFSGCASDPKYHTLTSTFNSNEVSWATNQGDSTVEGSAFLRTKGGDIKTCAGEYVVLVPKSGYADEIFHYVYDNNERGLRQDNSTTRIYNPKYPFANIDPAYSTGQLKTMCDSRGNFIFKNVSAGEFYIETFVGWEAVNKYGRYEMQGGSIMQRINVTPSSTTSVILTL